MADDKKKGGFFSGFGANEALALGGGVLNAITGRSQAKASKEMMRRSAQGIQAQNEMFRYAQPMYQNALQQLAAHAAPGNGQGAGLNGAWGNAEDRLRMTAAEDNISRLARQRSAQLQHTLGQRHIATGSQGAALAQNERSAMRDLAGFNRQLAINAPQEWERRQGLLLNAMNPALSMGQNAISNANQMGQYYGNQAAQSFGGIGQLAQGYFQNQALQNYLNSRGGQPGGATVNPDGTIAYSSAFPETEGYGEVPWWAR